MKSKFIPGPWRVKRSTHIVDGKIKEYHWVGFGTHGDETPVLTKTLPENEANAALIAAAPDMLDALFSAYDLIKNELGYGEVTAKIEAAFNKAQGKA